ncbi:suppressor of cytokine signaling 2 isoform X4 [Rattus norvegicus]|uniref:suppressor of cytokine signaling 2 isoform X4 n=1 Tax=Rattus norvegicus TaxID=10116 RepID=UPI002FD82084
MSLSSGSRQRCADRGQCAPGLQARGLKIPCARSPEACGRHLVPQIKRHSGNSDGHPSSPPGSPAPCPLGRLPGAEAAVAVAEAICG